MIFCVAKIAPLPAPHPQKKLFLGARSICEEGEYTYLRVFHEVVFFNLALLSFIHFRENTVALLITLGAAPGALTDPSPEFPLGRTPADLASANGYKGISGFLAESSLTAHLASLTMTDQKVDSSLEDSIYRAVQTIKERVATPGDDGDGSDLSLKDSLAAVRNATQAAGRIHQVFRMQSFQRKQISSSDDESLLTDERVLSLISYKIQKPGQTDELVHSAAIRIQKKFRGWKQRKEFLIIRERVVKIQVHLLVSLWSRCRASALSFFHE